jgi:hypothetical protein
VQREISTESVERRVSTLRGGSLIVENQWSSMERFLDSSRIPGKSDLIQEVFHENASLRWAIFDSMRDLSAGSQNRGIARPDKDAGSHG